MFTRLLAFVLCLAFPGVGHAQKFFANENRDDGIEARTTLRYEDYHAPTPLTVAGAKTVSTEDVYKLTQEKQKPLLIDVLGGAGHQTIPGAIWWSGAGLGYRGESVNRDAQGKFSKGLIEATGGDKGKQIVFFCLSQMCWLSYNAALRAVAEGYTNVYWYRGGIESWKAARNYTGDSGESKY